MEFNGGGKYDAICENALIEAKAAGVLLIVIGGDKGIGFSCSVLDPRIIESLPDILEGTAKEIRKLREK